MERSILAGFNSSNENKDFTSLRIKETGFRAKYNYELNNGISLYGLLGIGGYETSYFNDMYSYGNIGFNLGAGAKMILKGNLFAGIDLRYHFLPEWEVKENDNEYKPIKSGAGLFVPTFFMGYSF